MTRAEIEAEFRARVGDAEYSRYAHMTDYWVNAFAAGETRERFLVWMNANIGPRLDGSIPGAGGGNGNGTGAVAQPVPTWVLLAAVVGLGWLAMGNKRRS
jgi:hypothetical protein